MCDSIDVRFKWQCPYCGHQNTSVTRLVGPNGRAEVRLAYCDMDEGGCDNQVALRPLVTIAATVYKLIEADNDAGYKLGEASPAPADEAIESSPLDNF